MSRSKKIVIYSLILLLIVGLIAVIYFKTDLLKTKEQLFWKCFLKEKDEIINVLSNDKIKTYNEKIKKSSYIKEGDLSIVCEKELLKPIDVKITEKGNNLKDYKNTVLNLKYDNKDVNETIIIKDENYYFVKNELLGNNYIGFENDNLKQLAKKFGINNTDFIPNKIKDIDYVDLLKISDEEMDYISDKYIPICRRHVKNKHYIKEENVELDNISGKVVSYKVQVTEKQFNDMIIDLLTELSNDGRTLNLICNKIKIIDETNKYCEVDNLRNQIEEVIKHLKTKNVEDEIFLSIIIYKNENENDVVKTELVLNNDRTISIETNKRNKITIKQYDIKNNEPSLENYEAIIRTALNTISEITYTKEIENNEISKVDLNIKCNLGIDNITINYNYVEQIKNDVENLIRKNEIKYMDLNKLSNDDYKTILKKVLEINYFGIGKKYFEKK